MYMPVLAQFTARDPLPPDGEPVLLGGVPNTAVMDEPGAPAERVYAYARNSPSTYFDPSGLISTKYVGPVPGGPPDPPNLSARYEVAGMTVRVLYKQYGNHKVYFDCFDPCANNPQKFVYSAFTLDLLQFAKASKVFDDHVLPIQSLCNGGPGASKCCKSGTWRAGSAADLLESKTMIQRGATVARQYSDVTFRGTPCAGGAFTDVIPPVSQTGPIMKQIAKIEFTTVMSLYDESDGTFKVTGGKCDLTTKTKFSHADYIAGPGGSGFP